MKALIIDDELHSRETTKMLLDMLNVPVDVVGLAKDALEGVKMIIDTEPDLIFLDVQMPKVSGIEMLDLVPQYKGEIIFITAHNQYAIEAFKKGAIHYLLKPLDLDELEEAVVRVQKMVSGNQKAQNSGVWISLSTSDGWIVLKKSDIIRAESYKNYTTIYTHNAKHTISKTLKDVESNLSPDYFYRVHNTHVVNISHVEKVLKTDGGNVLCSNGDLVPISKGRKKDFFDWFKDRLDTI